MKPILPTDPRLPASARWFFFDMWVQLESIGFEPVIYLRAEAVANGGGCVLMILEHPINQDGVAASVTFGPGSSGVNVECCVEFSTESPERVDVTTSNASNVDIIPRLSNERVLRFPDMRDLAGLYRVHGLHFALSDVQEKRRFPAPTQIPADMQNSALRRFRRLADLGTVRFTDDGRHVAFNWRFVLGVTWRLLPVNRRRCLQKARRRAIHWLTHHGMPAYLCLDYARLIANVESFTRILPVPDWYPSPDETVDRWFRSCDACRSRIAADRPDCETLTCPSCGLVQAPIDESPLIAFDCAPQASE